MSDRRSVVFHPIGLIHSEHREAENTPIQPVYASDCVGTVELFPEFVEGLDGLDGFSHIYLLYHLDRAAPAQMRVKPFLGDRTCGLFATRAPCRPNAIGLSIVRLCRVEGAFLHVVGLDVLDRTPLLDIKPYTVRFDHVQTTHDGWHANVSEPEARQRGRRGYRGGPCPPAAASPREIQ